MSFKNYVCVTCAQDFTRKYSAYRHNRILHQERGKIVRTLEYVIGRVTGEYSSVDPIVFRRKNKQGTAIDSPGDFPFIAIAHNSRDSQSYENIRQKEYKSSKHLKINPPQHILQTNPRIRARQSFSQTHRAFQNRLRRKVF